MTYFIIVCQDADMQKTSGPARPNLETMAIAEFTKKMKTEGKK